MSNFKTKVERVVKQSAEQDQSDFAVAYVKFTTQLKEKIRIAQIKASLAVNRELIKAYWEIGKTIVEKQKSEKWGTGIVEKVAEDLRSEFPGVEGFSARNIWRMRAFYKRYHDDLQLIPKERISEGIVQQALEAIPWGHNCLLLEKLDSLEERLWYARMTVSEGWSRHALLEAITNNRHKTYATTTGRSKIEPAAHISALTREILTDPYHFDFLELSAAHAELDLKRALSEHVVKFFMELGQGFAFVGSKVPLEVGNQTFYVDLLFYHLQLRRFVVIELQAKDFKPESIGRLSFNMSVVDDRMRHPSDGPTIGLTICKKKDNFVAEYALRDVNKTIGVAEYMTKIAESLPDELKGKLPTINDIEAELSALSNKKF